MLAVRGLTWIGAAAVLATPFFSPGSPVSLVRVAVEQPTHLTISGSVHGLRHAVPATLQLTLTSGSEAAVVVRSLTVQVTGASHGCAPAALAVGSWAGALVVPAHGSATAGVGVTLNDPHGHCTGGTWQLAYTSA
jgi:hypothetical protein